ncbi:MAG TPA: hypothetical protein VMS43_00595 [Allosphingosinicella sp.]|nr:hypothetical protein [Allosphingosinicella sp.]
MRSTLRGIAALVLIVPGAAPLAACSSQAQEPVPPEVRAVIERSRHPTTDYTSLHVDRVVSGNERFTATTAEYHRGTQHRIETRPTRTLIDCATGAAIVYDVSAATTERMEGGAGMCGIADSEPVLSGRLLPPETGRFGRTDIVELTGPDFVRRYAVTEDGILASANYEPRRADVPTRVETVHAEIRRGSPDPAMFEEASLARAFAPAPETLMPGANQPER